MFIEATINYWAVLACVAVSMLIGYIWYSLPVFGRTWMNLIGKTEADLKQGAGPAMGLTVLLSFISAYVFAHIVDYVGSDTLGEGLLTGWWLWLGFPFTVITVQNLFAQRPMKLSWINAGYHLAQFLAFGAILASW